jgi:hypothetical protein
MPKATPVWEVTAHKLKLSKSLDPDKEECCVHQVATPTKDQGQQLAFYLAHQQVKTQVKV